MKLLDAIDAHGYHLASKAALVDDLGETSYAELAGGVAAVARMLAADGVRPGDVVALAIESTVPAVALLLGTMAAGAIAAPVNTRLADPEIADYLGRIRPVVLLADPATGIAWDRVRSFDRMHEPGSLRHRLGLPATGSAAGSADRPSLPDTAAGSAAGSADRPSLPDTAPAVALPTGGTTGVPKAALWSRGGISDITISNCIHLGVGRFDGELYIASLFHITIVAGLFPTLYAGGTVRLAGRFDDERTTAVFETFKPTRILTTPTAFARIVERLVPSDELAEHRITVIYGAARNAPDFRRKVLEKLPRARLITGYGATEYGPVARLFPEDPEAEMPGALGRPISGARLTIVSDDGTERPRGEIGELLVKAPWQMIGYLGGTDSPMSPDGSVHSGDLGWVDPGGCFFLSGRSKEVIKTGGENVYPNEVEDVLQQLPSVADVGVYGMEDEQWGERVEAAVVLAAGASADGAELKELCSRHLAGYKIPKRFRFVSAIPYTPNMKLDRRRLQDEARLDPPDPPDGMGGAGS